VWDFIVLCVSISTSLYELLSVYRHHCSRHMSLIEIRRRHHARCRHRLLAPSGVGFSSLFWNESDKSVPRRIAPVKVSLTWYCTLRVLHECVISYLVCLNVFYKDCLRCGYVMLPLARPIFCRSVLLCQFHISGPRFVDTWPPVSVFHHNTHYVPLVIVRVLNHLILTVF
jgi:hypothetical protein